VLAADRRTDLVKPLFVPPRLKNHWRFKALIQFLLFNPVANDGHPRQCIDS